MFNWIFGTKKQSQPTQDTFDVERVERAKAGKAIMDLQNYLNTPDIATVLNRLYVAKLVERYKDEKANFTEAYEILGLDIRCCQVLTKIQNEIDNAILYREIGVSIPWCAIDTPEIVYRRIESIRAEVEQILEEASNTSTN